MRRRGVDAHLELDGPYSIVGRAVIVHGNPDDLTSQPSGNAGPRVGCGLIQRLPMPTGGAVSDEGN